MPIIRYLRRLIDAARKRPERSVTASEADDLYRLTGKYFPSTGDVEIQRQFYPPRPMDKADSV